jgi:hypothetical protein
MKTSVFLLRPAILFYLIISVRCAARRTLGWRVFFRPLVLFRSSAGAFFEGRFDFRQDLVQGFLNPQLRAARCLSSATKSSSRLAGCGKSGIDGEFFLAV